MRRLLIIACSATKRQTDDCVSAVELYDGPAYRILRGRRANLAIVIVSAEHGLIGGWMPISTYDRKMTPERARELQAAGKFDELACLVAGDWDAIHVHAGKTYRDALDMDLLRRKGATVCSGGIGKQLGQLKAWLEKTAAIA